MSYSIREGIEDAREFLASKEEVARLYPDAIARDLPGGRREFVSEKVAPTDVEVVVGPGWIGEEKTAYLLGYVPVGRMRVYAPVRFPQSVALVLGKLQKEAPEAYAAIIKLVSPC